MTPVSRGEGEGGHNLSHKEEERDRSGTMMGEGKRRGKETSHFLRTGKGEGGRRKDLSIRGTGCLQLPVTGKKKKDENPNVYEKKGRSSLRQGVL